MDLSAAALRRYWSVNRKLLIFAVSVIALHTFQEIFIGQSALGALVANILQITCAAIAAGACIAASRRAAGFYRAFWILIGLSFLIWSIADLGWIYYESFLRESPARDSIFHFMVDCRALLVAMALLLDPDEPESGQPDAAWILDVSQLFIMFTLIYLGWYQAASHAQSRELSLLRSDQIELGENIAVLALAVVQILRAKSRNVRMLYAALLIALAPIFAGICLTDYQEWHRGFEMITGTWRDLFWTVTFLATAAWAVSWKVPSVSTVAVPRPRHFWSMLLENAFYAGAPLIVLIQVKELGSDWRLLAFFLLGISILCFAARLALSKFRETAAARRLQQAYGALFQSELRFRTLIEDAPLAVGISRHAKTLWANRKYQESFGYDRVEELVGLPIGQMIAPEYREQLERIARLRSSGEDVPKHYESVGLRKDGTRFDAEFDVAQVLLPDGQATLAFISDISERKRADEALRASEDRYRDLVEHSEDLVCTHDLEGRLLSVNPAPARLLGYDVSELLNAPMRDLVAPEFRNQFDTYLEEIKQKGAAKGLLCVLAKDGTRRIWEYSNTLRTEGVPLPVVRGLAHDVTERTRAQAALRASEARLRLFVEHSPAAVALFDREMRYIQASRRWMTDFALGDRDLHGISHYEVFPEIPERWKEVHRRALAGEVVIHDGDRFERADGSVNWLRWQVHPWRESNGQIGGIAIFSEDITARKQAERALRQSEERFRVALKDSPITVFNQDHELRYTWVYNPQLYWEQEILGKTDDELLGVKKAATLTDLKRKVLSTGVAIRQEVAIPQNGNRYVFDMSIEPLFNAHEDVVGVTGACINIACLREMADRLQESTERLSREKSYLQNEIQTELGFEEIIGQSTSLREVLRKARVVAPTDSTVLLLGETGTGKELVARSVHDLSTRHENTFVKLNCAAVPSGLLESELFGHEKGAFTGAVSQKVGRIELAHKGTLFLDEIGEMPLELQPKLLRVLQDREFERLGGVRTLCVDVRIVAATNRDLRQDVADKKFREDLFYRLNVFPIELPPLRNRKEDIPSLVHHFVQKHTAKMNKHIDVIPSEVMRTLCTWNWPGNIRELENMIERMVIMSKGTILTSPPAEIEEEMDHGDEGLADMEREHILRILRMAHGVLSGPDGAANRLGLKRTTLQSMMKRLGIEPSEYRDTQNGTSPRH